MRQFFTSKKINLFILLAILIITSWAYLTCLSSELVDWDDQFQISNNLDIKSWSLISVQKIFSNYYAGMYQPLATLSFALEHKIWRAFPLFLHLDNLLLHLLNIVLVYFLTKKLFRRFSVALISAGLFALHPMQVETVAWISARSNLLYSTFSLATLIAYANYCQKPKTKNYLITGTLFILALLSKVPAVVLPLIFLIFDYYYQRPLTKRLLLEKLPFFALSLVIGWVAIKGRLVDSELPAVVYSWLDRLLFITYSPLDYLQKIILPYNLSPFYALPEKINNHLPIIFYLSVPVCLIFAWLLFKYRAKKFLTLGMTWFLLLILPSIQITTFSTTLTADRYAYLASLGIFWLLSLAILFIWERFKNLKIFLISALLLTLVCLFIQTSAQARVWKNSISLWSEILVRNPKSTNTYINLGNAKAKNNDPLGAMEAYKSALKIDKQNYFIYNNIGVLLAENLNKFPESIEYYNQAIKLNPNEGLFYYNRGSALLKLNRPKEALVDYRLAVKLKSGENFYNYSYLNSLANLEYKLNHFAEADKAYTEIIAAESQLADPYFFRGLVKIKLKNLELGCQDLRLAEKMGYQDKDKNLANFCK